MGENGIYGPEGAWTYWHANGTKSAMGAFSVGYKVGAWRSWHTDGSLKSEGNYQGGQKVDIWNFQSEDGVQTTRDYGGLPPIAYLTYDEYRTHIRCHFDNPDSAEAALRCAESAYLASARFLPPASATVQRGEFHLYRNRDDYRLAEWRKTQGRYKNSQVFTLYDEALTYVYVSPPTSDQVLDQIGLPIPTLERIARAAALNVLVWRMPAFRELPAWLKSGFRAYVAHRATTPSDASLRTATWFPLAEIMAAEERLPSATEIITTGLEGFTTDERYALHAAVFALLAQDDQLPQLFAELARHAKGDTAGFEATLDTWLTEARLESLDAQLPAFIES